MSLKEHRHMFKEGESVLKSWTIRLRNNPTLVLQPSGQGNLKHLLYWGFTFRQDRGVNASFCDLSVGSRNLYFIVTWNIVEQVEIKHHFW